MTDKNSVSSPAGESTDIFSEKNRVARDLADSWFKFEKVGDRVSGVIRDMWEAAEHDGMPAQRCWTLETSEGKLVNVGTKRTDYNLSRTNDLQLGDKLGIEFAKEVPSKKFPGKFAKSLLFYKELVGERGSAIAGKMAAPKPADDEVAF